MHIRSRVFVGFVVAVTGLAAAAVVAPRTGTGGVAAATVGAAQASAAAATVPYVPYPSTGTELYVYNAAKSNCSDSGVGTQSQPFCTIAAAANAVRPGQTVVVEPGTYAGATISVQGTPAAPITFTAILGATVSGSSSAPVFTVSGAHNVVLNGFSAFPGGAQQAFDVTGGSSGITINGGYAGIAGLLVPSIEVGGTSSGVTVSRMAIGARNGVQVDPGASGVVITGNSIIADMAGTWGVLVTDAPGTDVTGNTVRAICSGGISVTGASSGVTVENNIVQAVTSGGASPCAAGTAISVSAGSEANSVIGYNLIDPPAGGPLYDWGGTSYTSLADFQAASGQGAHDIAADPGLGQEQFSLRLLPSQNIFWFPLNADSPAIDSADANAVGELPTDQFGHPRTDDPDVANSGTGGGYYDRAPWKWRAVPSSRGARVR
jgi:parallel beta helix pectate lyase-like protein